MNLFTRQILLFALLCFSFREVRAQLTVTDNQTALSLVQALTGAGVVVLNPTLTCAGVSNAKFTGTSNLGIDSGIVLTSGIAKTNGAVRGVNGPQVDEGPNDGGSAGTPGDASLNTVIPGVVSNNACVLQFDFVPAGDSIKFDYVFASTEYQDFSCGEFNDVFGFFISGPGYATPLNIARIPGTSIPICVNSTTNPALNSTPTITAGCTAMGTGSPFTAYYINNSGGTSITYRGFTTVFTAAADVSPCDTYHLKLAIADGSGNGFDAILDSGVFLKAGSLSSTSIYVKTTGGGGLEAPFTNTVRGCPPGKVRISRSGNLTEPLIVPLQLAGTAINGTDYVTVPGSVTIPAGDSVTSFLITGIPVFPAVGPKSVIINVLSPYNCGGQPVIVASDTIMIYDSIYVNILTADTVVCRGRQVNILVEADDILEFSWAPAASLNNPNIKNPTATALAPVMYTLTARLPGSLGVECKPTTDRIFIDVRDTPQVDLGPDRMGCGNTLQLFAATQPVNPDETFSWSPATALSNASIRDPLATPLSDIEYVVTVNPGAAECNGYDTIRIKVWTDIIILNQDTVVCSGSKIQLRALGDTAFGYHWTPELNIEEPLLPNTILNAVTSGYYALTASYPGCNAMHDSFYVEVQPVPAVSAGPDLVICSYDTAQLYTAVTPSAYQYYTYDWSPGAGLSDSAVQAPVFDGNSSVLSMSVLVKTPLGCSGSDTISIKVNQGDFLSVQPSDTGLCPPARIQLQAEGAEIYSWSPSWGLDRTDIPNPVATLPSSVAYTLTGSRNYNGHTCYDTQMVQIEVYPAAVIDLPDSARIWPGESYRINPGGNCLYYQWFPPSGLSADNVSDPLAQPEVRTRYFVTAKTEAGCVVKDSIDILVSTESVLDIPNAFNPAGSDFRIVKRGIARLKYFRIFNRWGNKVFETSDINQGWDGRYHNSPQPIGVYLYSIEAETNTGKPFKKDGNFTLLR